MSKRAHPHRVKWAHPHHICAGTKRAHPIRAHICAGTKRAPSAPQDELVHFDEWESRDLAVRPSRMGADTRAYRCVCVCVFVCVCVYTMCVCVCVLCVYIYVYVYVMYMCIYMYVCTYVCVYVCVYVCMNVKVYIYMRDLAVRPAARKSSNGLNRNKSVNLRNKTLARKLRHPRLRGVCVCAYIYMCVHIFICVCIYICE
jgi:hypothetical protein